jgi:hypothetical protein
MYLKKAKVISYKVKKQDMKAIRNIALSILVILLLPNVINAQTYPSSQGDNTTYEYISNVQIGSINNTSDGTDADGDGTVGYDDFTSQTAVLIPGSTYALAVTIEADNNDYIRAWIDWNDDGDFTDSGENYSLVDNTNSNGPHSVNITVPMTASGKHLRLRVSLKWNAASTSAETFDYGEVEDYSLYVDKDNDGDGVYDTQDLDADNDGMLDEDENFCLTQDFLNGNFETGPFPSGYVITDASNVDGWNTTAADNQIEIWKSGFHSVPAYEGGYFAEINANRNKSNETVGTGTTTGKHLPMEMNRAYTYSQSIVLSTDFPTEFQNNGGVINKISYYYNGNSSNTDDIKIYMANTSKSSFSSNSDWEVFANLSLVYDGTISTTTTAGWIEITLTTPFQSDGSNIVVAFDENTTGRHSGSDEFYSTSVSGRRSIYYYNNSTNPDPSSPPNATGRNSYIPNMKFEIVPAQRLYQTLVVDPGDIVKWNVAHRGRAGTDVMNIVVGPTGSPTVQQTATTGNTSWHVYSSSYTVPAGVTEIEIGFEAVSTATGNTSVGNFIDDIQLYITKTTYCDSDGDGIANIYDLDADNDGIADVIEAGGTDPDNDGRIGTGPITDTDGDGLSDLVDTDNGGTPLTKPNSDSDPLDDYMDIDSDNDGIVDNIEGQTTAGYTAPLGTDANSNGWDDRYDGGASGTAIPLTDTDNDGTADYIDTNSDDDGGDDATEAYDTDKSGTTNTPPTNTDSDGDGLDDAYDVDGTSTTDSGGPTNNSQTANSFPNDDNSTTSERDWREILSTLPVSLISFEAELIDDYVELSWTTASEINNDYFMVQRSIDNKNYEDIDKVAGNGNSNIIVDYNSYDMNLPQGIIYYRLKQVDYDGTTDYSDVVVIRNQPEVYVHIFPNPSDGNINIETINAIDVIIYTITGQQVENYYFEANSVNAIDISDQPKGVYMLTYYSNNERIIKKLIVR